LEKQFLLQQLKINNIFMLMILFNFIHHQQQHNNTTTTNNKTTTTTTTQQQKQLNNPNTTIKTTPCKLNLLKIKKENKFSNCLQKKIFL